MTTARPQQRYDHRLRELVQRIGDLSIATDDRGVPRSTARGWLRTPTVTVSLDVANLNELELRQEILKLRRHVQKLAALLRLALSPLTSAHSAAPGPSCDEAANRCNDQ